MTKQPVQPQDKYVLRLPDGLRDRIKRAAEESGRSMNAEIVQVLMDAFPEPSTLHLSLPDLIEVEDAWVQASGFSFEDRPISSEILKQVWAIETGQDEAVKPEVRTAVRKVLKKIKDRK